MKEKNVFVTNCNFLKTVWEWCEEDEDAKKDEEEEEKEALFYSQEQSRKSMSSF